MARADEAAALQALGDVEDADATAEIGLAVIAALGNDAPAFERAQAQCIIDAAGNQSGRPQITFGTSNSVRGIPPPIGR